MNNKSVSANGAATTRREFLRTSATAVAVASVAGLDISRSAYAAGSDILRVGMIGCGGRNTGAGAQALRADKGAR
ncbi:MAG: twin-arginine translocation signal domain-containing protein, partial [Verrucomicrobiia bacterium]